jgi:transposase
MMRFYDQQHPFYAGIDLHSRTMHLCVLDATGTVVFDKNLPCQPDAFLDAIAPFRPNVIIGAECMFGWYWLADLCQKESLSFLIGHALYMKAIHGKAKNDRIDANKIARLLRGGNFPLAYVYPKGMRETRDLLRRRTWFVRQRASLFTHLQISKPSVCVTVPDLVVLNSPRYAFGVWTKSEHPRSRHEAALVPNHDRTETAVRSANSSF